MINNISKQAHKLLSLTNKKSRNSKTKVLSITSGKGGVGKSTISANLAYLFSQKGLNIAVLDADIGLANMQVLLNTKPKYTFFDYLDNKAQFEQIFTQTSYNNITLIAGKSGYEYIQNDTSSLVFSRLIEDIVALNQYDILLIDTGAGLNEYVQEFLSVADEILAVTTTDPSAITDVYALIKMLSNTQEKLLICFNHTAKYSIGENITNSIKELAKKNGLNKNFMVKYIGSINSIQNVQVTGRLRKLFAKEFSYDQVTESMAIIAQKIVAEFK
jgi:flagellar biosynthesis protein FlhG